jgi:hypothetical protein
MIEWVLYKIGELIFWISCLFILGVFITLGFQSWQWFVTGAWPSVTPASLTQIPYAPETQYIGLNKIILWFWQSSIIFILLPLCFLFQAISSIFRNEKYF